MNDSPKRYLEPRETTPTLVEQFAAELEEPQERQAWVLLMSPDNEDGALIERAIDWAYGLGLTDKLALAAEDDETKVDDEVSS